MIFENPLIDSALVLALTEVVKRLFKFDENRYTPIISIAWGVIVVGMASGWSWGSAFAGLLVGLTASGLWSGVKTVAGK
jgi:hypothetical protein